MEAIAPARSSRALERRNGDYFAVAE